VLAECEVAPHWKKTVSHNRGFATRRRTPMTGAITRSRLTNRQKPFTLRGLTENVKHNYMGNEQEPRGADNERMEEHLGELETHSPPEHPAFRGSSS
jgi:hypothetical protein